MEISASDLFNARLSSQDIVLNTDEELFKQYWRLHLLDMLAPYCAHELPDHEIDQVQTDARRMWRHIMAEYEAYEEAMGF